MDNHSLLSLNVDDNYYQNVYASHLANSDSDITDEDLNKRRVMIVLAFMAFINSQSFITIANKQRNMIRNRPYSLFHISNWDDTMFRRQMRLSRNDLNNILISIAPRLERNEEMARRSSGSAISPLLKLAITCRILAGANYLDMDWFSVSVNSVMNIVYETCQAINAEIHNIYLPTSETDLMLLAHDWMSLQQARYDYFLTPGVILAGDGLIIEISQPTNTNNPFIFRNRHDCFALTVQAFCDAHCRFRVFDIKWPGSTNDLTAYTQTTLFNMMQNGNMPSWACILLDGIYGSLGGNHLTPFSRTELRRAEQDRNLHLKMRTFNQIISSMRVTIERAFGQLVRRFSLLWRRIDCNYDRVPLLATTCAILHNICVESWLNDGRQGGIGIYGPEPLEHINIQGLPQLGQLSDSAIMARLQNQFMRIESDGKMSDKRQSLMESMWNLFHLSD